MELLQYHKRQNNVSNTFSALTGNITVEFIYNRLPKNRQKNHLHLQPAKCNVATFQQRKVIYQVTSYSWQSWICATVYSALAWLRQQQWSELCHKCSKSSDHMFPCYVEAFIFMNSRTSQKTYIHKSCNIYYWNRNCVTNAIFYKYIIQWCCQLLDSMNKKYYWNHSGWVKIMYLAGRISGGGAVPVHELMWTQSWPHITNNGKH